VHVSLSALAGARLILLVLLLAFGVLRYAVILHRAVGTDATHTLIVLLKVVVRTNAHAIGADGVIHRTAIVRLTLGSQATFVFAELLDGIVESVLLAGAPPRNLRVAIGGAKWTALAVRGAG